MKTMDTTNAPQANVSLSESVSLYYRLVGNVTILPNFPIPTAGSLIEVKYLRRRVNV
jgi:hypothetical protein